MQLSKQYFLPVIFLVMGALVHAGDQRTLPPRNDPANPDIQEELEQIADEFLVDEGIREEGLVNYIEDCLNYNLACAEKYLVILFSRLEEPNAFSVSDRIKASHALVDKIKTLSKPANAQYYDLLEFESPLTWACRLMAAQRDQTNLDDFDCVSFVQLHQCWVNYEKLHEPSEILAEAHLPSVIGILEPILGVTITSLDLSAHGPSLKNLPICLGNLINLKHLNLRENQLNTLPGSFGDLKNLKTLLCNNNRFTQFPLVILKLKRLEDLCLANNELQKLPEEIGKLCTLRRLDLRQNKLTKLPQSLGSLPNLEKLYVHHNQLNELPFTLIYSDDLKELGLSENPLKKLPWMIFNLQRLEILDLGKCQLDFFPGEIFHMLPWVKLKLCWPEDKHIKIPQEYADRVTYRKSQP